MDGKMKYIILTSPYKTKEFLSNTKQKKLPENCFSDKEGFVVIKYLDGEKQAATLEKFLKIR